MSPEALRVLVVDDSADDFDLLLLALRGGGFPRVQAHRVDTEEQMREALDSGPWHVVLVDWILPRFSAPDALRILRENAIGVPCIVVSGFSGEEKAVLAIQLGARDFIPKGRLEALAPIVQRELMP